MAWILLEGLDRSGKSSVAEYYKGQGYEVVHMSAPDKKYFRDDYGGESYLEEVMRMYSKYDGKDVIFDRTPYGELIWPNIYTRLPLLNEEDLEYLGQMERNNEASKILMFDSNTDAHWQRCVNNKEPLNRQQFGRANIFYERLHNDYGFVKKELPDFPEIMSVRPESDATKSVDQVQSADGSLQKSNGDSDSTGTNNETSSVGGSESLCSDEGIHSDVGSVEDRLERANAIRALLSGKIVKKKGDVYDDLESSIRGYLQRELDGIFTTKLPSAALTNDEVTILKVYAQRIKEKMG